MIRLANPGVLAGAVKAKSSFHLPFVATTGT